MSAEPSEPEPIRCHYRYPEIFGPISDPWCDLLLEEHGDIEDHDFTVAEPSEGRKESKPLDWEETWDWPSGDHNGMAWVMKRLGVYSESTDVQKGFSLGWEAHNKRMNDYEDKPTISRSQLEAAAKGLYESYQMVTSWEHLSENNKDCYRDRVKAAFHAIGMNVEGEADGK